MISHLHFSYILLIPIQSLSLSREGRLVEWLETTGKSPVRSYLAGNAGSRLISEAKQPWACLVLGWGTTGEAHVLYSPYSILLSLVFFSLRRARTCPRGRWRELFCLVCFSLSFSCLVFFVFVNVLSCRFYYSLLYFLLLSIFVFLNILFVSDFTIICVVVFALTIDESIVFLIFSNICLRECIFCS